MTDLIQGLSAYLGEMNEWVAVVCWWVMHNTWFRKTNYSCI